MTPPLHPAARPAVQRYLPATLSLFEAANDASGGRCAPSVAAGDDTIESWFLRKDLAASWVVSEGEVVLAHVGVRKEVSAAHAWGLPAGPAWVEVCRLAVHPSFQRSGLARHLMGHVSGLFPSSPLWLTCHAGSPAHVLYLGLGWVESDLPISWPDDPTPGMLLTRSLLE